MELTADHISKFSISKKDYRKMPNIARQCLFIRRKSLGQNVIRIQIEEHFRKLFYNSTCICHRPIIITAAAPIPAAAPPTRYANTWTASPGRCWTASTCRSRWTRSPSAKSPIPPSPRTAPPSAPGRKRRVSSGGSA